MAISSKLRGYMNRCGTSFEELAHEPAQQMARAAEAAHVPGRQVAKGVLVRAGDEYMLAVVPASKHVGLDRLQSWLGREVALAEEQDSAELFADCDLGAIPPVGAAFGIETVLDEDMLTDDDVYFEGGDHNTLIHVNAANWRRLQREASHCAISV
jgi:Ala-tRNA(Pro) deacylase